MPQRPHQIRKIGTQKRREGEHETFSPHKGYNQVPEAFIPSGQVSSHFIPLRNPGLQRHRIWDLQLGAI